jgi:DNA polymerase-3 subunit epsilon
MSRLIVLDCETTGLDEKTNRIIELGCVELWDSMPTGNEYHVYINPHQIMNEEVIAIHGITNEFLADKAPFSHYVNDILEFIGSDPIVAHNAQFDMKFLNSELNRLFYKPLKNTVIDTLEIARKLYGTGNNLDNLCKRYGVNNSNRKVHGALLDAQLLSKVYYFLNNDYNNQYMEDNLWFQEEKSQDNQESFVDFEFPIRSQFINLQSKYLENHENFMKNILKCK